MKKSRQLLGISAAHWFWTVFTVFVLLLCAAFFDADISHALTNWPEYERAFFHLVSRTGMADWILIPSLLIAIACSTALLFKQSFTNKWTLRSISSLAWLIFLGVGTAGVMVQVFKRLIGRARPMLLEEFGPFYFEPFTADWAFHSFPSGHTTTAFALVFLIAAIWGAKWGALAYVWAGLVAVARLTEGAHFFTDIIGGILCGTFFASLIFAQFKRRGFPIEQKEGARINHTSKLLVRGFRKLMQ